jgi:hypothetical protein
MDQATLFKFQDSAEVVFLEATFLQEDQLILRVALEVVLFKYQ